MKKYILLLFSLSLLSMCSYAQRTYPKGCIKTTISKQRMTSMYSSAIPNFHITTSKATISAPLLPVGLVEASINNGQLQTGALLSVGFGWSKSIANVTVFEDSTVLVSNTLGYGIVGVYGQSTLTNKSSFIVAPVLVYGDFTFGYGLDVKASSNMGRIVATANIAGILPSLWTSIGL